MLQVFLKVDGQEKMHGNRIAILKFRSTDDTGANATQRAKNSTFDEYVFLAHESGEYCIVCGARTYLFGTGAR